MKIKNNAAYQRHISKININDPFFFLAHKYYLAKNLTFRQRLLTTKNHYDYEVNQFDFSYFQSVYCSNGLTLWSATKEGTNYDIKLMPGNDVLYEGGCSIVFFINDKRICVISYSFVPTEFLLSKKYQSEHKDETKPSLSVFVTRKQSTSEHDYQKTFNKDFDRTTPAHLCIGALAGIATAQGFNSFIGISPEVHPSIKQEYQRSFDVAYTQFWDSLHGKTISTYGQMIELPLHMTPIEELEQKVRKRAMARREHINQVCHQASQVIKKHLITT